ncbi:DUF6702 family protein [uncultured Psychroserpens sp.]|uniref:DUF6702 family protein n=1 Tax=uncultured Psychroserpens sp. TaxID=255436 RepID=UPI0026318519|nr:DUF6702 family protein [uncultured Psychroserpens sp.]
MKFFKVAFLALMFPLFLSSAHKYYVSVMQLTYVEDKQSVQMISRIDVADLEYTLQERYDKKITLTDINEHPMVDEYIKKYLNQKIEIKINTQDTPFNFIGKEYENDLVVCYLEIENIKAVNTIEISNSVLFDLFPKQKNVVKTKINSKTNNLIFTTEDRNQYLNFK